MQIRVAMLVGLVVGFVVGVATMLSTANTQGPTTSPCLIEDIQTHIIQAERPNMGPLEQEFWQTAIKQAAQKHNLDAAVLTALIAEESHFRGRAVSNRGAKGAAQLMPVWTKGIDPFEVEANLNRGAEVLAKYASDSGSLRGGLRRYNGGPKGEAIKPTGAYADAILARVYLAEKAVCHQQKIKDEVVL